MNTSGRPEVRRYDATGRQARAADTRRAVLAAATELFVENGFASTKISDIARRSGVSAPTVYAGFTSKAELLRQAIDVALAGDDEQVAVADRATAAWVDEAETGAELLSRMAVMMGELSERSAAVLGVLINAAAVDPELAALRDRFDAQRLMAADRISGDVERRGPFAAGVTRTEARDLIWLYTAPEQYLLLVNGRGWTTEQYVAWARSVLLNLVPA